MKSKTLIATLVAALLCSPSHADEIKAKATTIEAPSAHACKSFRPSNSAWNCGRVPVAGTTGAVADAGGRSR